LITRQSKSLKQRLSAFLDEHIYPSEKRYYQNYRPLGAGEVMRNYKPKARAAGLWKLFLPDDDQGAGLPIWNTRRCAKYGP